MLGHTILDVAEHLLDGLIPGPRTDRGHLGLGLVFSVVATVVELCVFVLVGNPVRGLDWSFGVMVGSMLCAASAFVLSAVSLIRRREHRRLAASTATVGAAAFLCPLALMW